MYACTDVLARGVLCDHAEPDDEAVAYVGRHHVDLARSVDIGQQLLVDFVLLRTRLVAAAQQAEAHETQLANRSY